MWRYDLFLFGRFPFGVSDGISDILRYPWSFFLPSNNVRKVHRTGHDLFLTIYPTLKAASFRPKTLHSAFLYFAPEEENKPNLEKWRYKKAKKMDNVQDTVWCLMCVACLLCSYKNRPPSERRLLVLLVAAILLSIALIIALAVLSFHCKCTPRSKHTYLIACEMSRTRTDSHSFSQTINP